MTSRFTAAATPLATYRAMLTELRGLILQGRQVEAADLLVRLSDARAALSGLERDQLSGEAAQAAAPAPRSPAYQAYTELLIEQNVQAARGVFDPDAKGRRDRLADHLTPTERRDADDFQALLPTCVHPQFHSNVNVVRVQPPEADRPTRFVAEIKVNCRLCRMPFVLGGSPAEVAKVAAVPIGGTRPVSDGAELPQSTTTSPTTTTQERTES